MSRGRRAFPLVISAPSGVGKTSLARALVERHADVVFSLSATTRPPRSGERDGRDYRFVDESTFDRLLERGELVEWATVHGRRYGTLRDAVEAGLAAGNCVVLDIDVQGARRIRELRADAVLVFLLPPTGPELERRLLGRGSESGAERQVRLRTALEELKAWTEFDYVVVNEDFEDALGVLDAIVTAEAHRRSRDGTLGERVAGIENALNSNNGVTWE